MQLIGTKKCAATKAAERFFRDPRPRFPLRRPSPSEVFPRVNSKRSAGEPPGKSLIDEDSPAYKKRGLAYMEFDELEELLENPLLLITPIIREGSVCIVGRDEKAWKALAEKMKA